MPVAEKWPLHENLALRTADCKWFHVMVRTFEQFIIHQIFHINLHNKCAITENNIDVISVLTFN